MDAKEQIFRLNTVNDMWHTFSIIAVDRRDNRDKVTISEMLKYSDLEEPSETIIDCFTTKRNKRKVRSTRRIAT